MLDDQRHHVDNWAKPKNIFSNSFLSSYFLIVCLLNYIIIRSADAQLSAAARHAAAVDKAQGEHREGVAGLHEHRRPGNPL